MTIGWDTYLLFPCILVFLTVWQHGTESKYPERERSKQALYWLLGPSHRSHVALSFLHSLCPGSHKSRLRFTGRGSRLSLLMGQWEGSGRECGSRNIAMALLKSTVFTDHKQKVNILKWCIGNKEVLFGSQKT